MFTKLECALQQFTANEILAAVRLSMDRDFDNELFTRRKKMSA
jgi:hypothetical protein